MRLNIIRLNSISVKKYWYADVGDIIIFAGNDTSGIGFKGVDKPFEVKRGLDRIIDENKLS